MTITVSGMTVGLSEVAKAVVQELNDVGDAVGSLNQSFGFTGFRGLRTNGWGGAFGGWGGGVGGGLGGGVGGGKTWTAGPAFLGFRRSLANKPCLIAFHIPTPQTIPLPLLDSKTSHRSLHR